MKLILKTLLVICFVGVISATAHAMSDRIALVTIRFNQQTISYQDQLFKAVVEAVKAKPSVVFTVVGYAPQHGDSEKAAKLMQNTQYYTGKIVEDLTKIGVNSQQIRTNVETSANVRNEEVRVFVD